MSAVVLYLDLRMAGVAGAVQRLEFGEPYCPSLRLLTGAVARSMGLVGRGCNMLDCPCHAREHRNGGFS